MQGEEEDSIYIWSERNVAEPMYSSPQSSGLSSSIYSTGLAVDAGSCYYPRS